MFSIWIRIQAFFSQTTFINISNDLLPDLYHILNIYRYLGTFLDIPLFYLYLPPPTLSYFSNNFIWLHKYLSIPISLIILFHDFVLKFDLLIYHLKYITCIHSIIIKLDISLHVHVCMYISYICMHKTNMR